MITRQQLEQIGRLVKSEVLAETVLILLRSHFSELHFTYCQDDDVIAASPIVEDRTFNLYLVDSRSHCLCFTRDLAVATGVVVAEIETDQSAVT